MKITIYAIAKWTILGGVCAESAVHSMLFINRIQLRQFRFQAQ